MIYELFSERQKRNAKSGEDDVYQYNDAPKKLRVQIQQLFNDAIGPQYIVSAYDMHHSPDNWKGWGFINKTLCREIGVHELCFGSTDREQVLNYLASTDVNGFLNVVELCARYIDKILGKLADYQRNQLGIEQNSEEALTELNHRFRESGFGFQYESGQLIRMDSEYSHEEIVKPALRILKGSKFAGPQQEFLQAHRHYRAGEYSQAITEAAKAFESTLKTVCDIKGWEYEKGARASDLLKRVRAEGLWPDFLDASFDQLLATLNSGLPKVRNEQGAHGQGAEVRIVPDYVAAYSLHLAAAKIRLITEAATV